MELTSPSYIKELLAKHGTRPSKTLGQNFLIDKNVLEKIILAADLKEGETILEVGPGIGTLTKKLAQKAGQVIAVEKSQKMVEVLKETLADFENIKIIEEDILNFKPQVKSYKVVANIPYYLTSPLIRNFLENNPPAGGQPSEIVLLIQKEVAQRICAMPPEMSLLAVSVQFYAKAQIISHVSKNCFWPAPKVDSSIIKIIPRRPTSQELGCRTSQFFSIVKAGFSHPRKQLVNNLAVLKFSNGVKLDKYQATQWLLKNNLSPNQRAETLTVQDWVNLANTCPNLSIL